MTELRVLRLWLEIRVGSEIEHVELDPNDIGGLVWEADRYGTIERVMVRAQPFDQEVDLELDVWLPTRIVMPNTQIFIDKLSVSPA